MANLKTVLLTGLILSTAVVSAKTVRIVQGGKTFLNDVSDKQAADAYDDESIEEKFKIETLQAKVGDKLSFANRDEVSHNVSAMVGELTVFDVKLQEPGKSNDREVTLTKKGEHTIQCAIHPKMRIKLKVD